MRSPNALANYLKSLKRGIEDTTVVDNKKFESDLAVFRADHERGLAHYEATQFHAVEMLRSVITYGQATLKSAMLINVGAAAALLAFIGDIWLKGIKPEAVSSLTRGIEFFAFGVLVAAVGTASSYFTQYCYSENFQKAGIGFHVVTVLIVIEALVLFGLGVFESYQAFVEHLTPK